MKAIPKVVFIATLIGAVTIGAGCTTQPGDGAHSEPPVFSEGSTTQAEGATLPTPTLAPTSEGPSAELSGTLTAEEVSGTVYFIVENDAGRIGVVLPAGYAARAAGDGFALLDEQGEQVMVTGQEFHSAGGQLHDNDAWADGPEVDDLWSSHDISGS